jgi:hypothetical protein
VDGGVGTPVLFEVKKSPEPIRWRGYGLRHYETDVPNAFSCEDDDIYLGVSEDTLGVWSACIEVRSIEGDGGGATAEEALEDALKHVRNELSETMKKLERVLGVTHEVKKRRRKK